MSLIGNRTCRSVVKDAKIMFALVTSTIATAGSIVPDYDHRVVRVPVAALAADLNDCSHVTLTTVLVLPVPIIAPYDAQSHRYSTAGHDVVRCWNLLTRNCNNATSQFRYFCNFTITNSIEITFKVDMSIQFTFL